MELNVTKANLVVLVQKAYELSVPFGLGTLHYQTGGLTEAEAKELVSEDSAYPVSLDYVRGRACKMEVKKRHGELFILAPWFDHTNEQLKELLTACMPTGYVVPDIGNLNHNVSCGCYLCDLNPTRHPAKER